MENSAQSLSEKECVPCKSGGSPLPDSSIKELLCRLNNGWAVENGRLHKTYRFKNFAQALAFTNKVGALAEQQQHHPDIFLSWGKVIIELYTHKIQGLHENDFILAAKLDTIDISNSNPAQEPV
ncbi:MAG: 4a-hydroxytetrahydrobiopterin dehydratase [Sedimentisphaerales bacterium]|nr:4a-hydroxytetrahydrobiopterin dehydratase [Sedimentisphaerales bacterium]